MSGNRGASDRITEVVTAWPGVAATTGSRGEWSFRAGRRELGHLHGDHVAHFAFKKEMGSQLREENRVVDHPVFPGKPAMAARGIEDDADERAVVVLMRLNYNRIVERYGLPEGVAA